MAKSRRAAEHKLLEQTRASGDNSDNENAETNLPPDSGAQSYVAIGIATRATDQQAREEPELCVEDPLND
eukprot:2601710-Rhodomonas_salina.1